MTHSWISLNKLPWFDRFSRFLHHSLNSSKTTSLTEYLLFYLCLLVSLHLKNFTHYHVLIFTQIIPFYHGSHIDFIHYLVIVWFWGACHCRSRFAHCRVVVTTKSIFGAFTSKVGTFAWHQALVHCRMYWRATHSRICSQDSLVCFILSLQWCLPPDSTLRCHLEHFSNCRSILQSAQRLCIAIDASELIGKYSCIFRMVSLVRIILDSHRIRYDLSFSIFFVHDEESIVLQHLLLLRSLSHWRIHKTGWQRSVRDFTLYGISF